MLRDQCGDRETPIGLKLGWRVEDNRRTLLTELHQVMGQTEVLAVTRWGTNQRFVKDRLKGLAEMGNVPVHNASI